jgi:hypothetical protein
MDDYNSARSMGNEEEKLDEGHLLQKGNRV